MTGRPDRNGSQSSSPIHGATRRPFPKLLDSYVLKAIGHLDYSSEAALERMESTLRRVYAQPGSWSEIVASRMELPATFPKRIRRIWLRQLARAKHDGHSLDPHEFAQNFVNAQFARDVW
jgi:hypothetical protein